MGETEKKFLKKKCNMLIDRALQLEKEIEERDKKILQLQEKKKTLLEKKSEIPSEAHAPEQVQESSQIFQHDIPDESEQFVLVPLSSESTDSEASTDSEKSQYKNLAMQDRGELITSQRIFEMIQTLSTQIDTRPREEIVIRNLSGSAKFMEILSDITGKIFKFLIFTVIMALLSLAATVLLNSNLRNTIFEFIKSCIG